MDQLKLNLPHPATDKDVGFMEYLLRGVREKREEATAGPVIVKKERIPNELK